MANPIGSLSTLSPIGTGASWISGWFDVTGYDTGVITIQVDNAARIIIDYSEDSSTIDKELINIVSEDGPGEISVPINLLTQFIQLTLTNDITPIAQTVTRVQTILYDSTSLPTTSLLTTTNSILNTIVSTLYPGLVNPLTMPVIDNWASINIGDGSHVVSSLPFDVVPTVVASIPGITVREQDLNAYFSSYDDGSGNIFMNYNGPTRKYSISGYAQQDSSDTAWAGNVYMSRYDDSNGVTGQTVFIGQPNPSGGNYGTAPTTYGDGLAKFAGNPGTGQLSGFVYDSQKCPGVYNSVILEAGSFYQLWIGAGATGGTSTNYLAKLNFTSN